MTHEQQQTSQDILRNMANDLIEQYFLPEVRFFCSKKVEIFGFCVSLSL
jgi:hypothetical protein